MAIYVTGDIHLNHDSAKLNSTFFPEGKNLTKNDYVDGVTYLVSSMNLVMISH